MPYGSMHMPVGWNGLSMPNKGFSVHMSIVIINFEVRGVGQDSVPYIMEIILTHISFRCGIVDLDEYNSFTVLARPWSSLHMMLKFSGVVLCPVWVLCT